MAAGSRARKSRPAANPLARLRKICLALPAVEEKAAWGAPTWRVKGKIFAMFDDHHDPDHVSVHCSAPDGAQEALMASDPKHFFRPPYTGGKGWIGIRLDTGLPWSTVAALIEEAHRTIATKRRRTR
jgi:predicted DNA-binding protein (MmcQ/YjbR family)